MPPALPDRPPAYLSLWRQFHDALERDAQRLAHLLVDSPDIEPHELATWWDHFAPAVTQCALLAGELYCSVGGVLSDGGTEVSSALLRETVEAMGLAAGLVPAAASAYGDGRDSASSGRTDLARRAQGLVRVHAAASVAYLSRAVSPDAYRAWERRAVAALTYRNVAFLAPWLVDAVDTAGWAALRRDVPHLRAIRCDEVWIRRYGHVTAALPRVAGTTAAP